MNNNDSKMKKYVAVVAKKEHFAYDECFLCFSGQFGTDFFRLHK